MARYRPPWTHQRQRLRRPQEKWEVFVGWHAPEEYDETGIESWVKRKSSKVKSTGRKAAVRQEWEQYSGHLGTHCAAIPDEEAFIAESLKDSLKPPPKPIIAIPKSIPTQEQRAERKSGDKKEKNEPKTATAEPSTLHRAKRLLGLSQTQKKTVQKGSSNDIQDEEEGEAELGLVRFSNSDVPIIHKNELNIEVNHLKTDKAPSQDFLQNGILKLPSTGQNRSENNSILSSRQTDRSDVLAAPPTEPVKLCYTQSNISLMLQKPVENLVRTLSRDYLGEFGHKDEEGDEAGSLAPPLEDLVSDTGSWSGDSEPYNKPFSFKPPTTEYLARKPDIWYDDKHLGAEEDEEGDEDPRDYNMAALGKSHTIPGLNVPSFRTGKNNIYDNQDIGADFKYKVEYDLPSSQSKKTNPISLVMKKMEPMDVPEEQRHGLLYEQNKMSVNGEKPKRTKSSKSRSFSARGRQTPLHSPLPARLGQSLISDTDLPFLPQRHTFTIGLGSYINAYKDRLSSRVMPIGDLLPAVDTSLKSVLGARKMSGNEANRWRMPSAGNVPSQGEMSMTGREKFLPYEDSFILMREGVDMLKVKDHLALVGPPAFRNINNRTPLHRAQENAKKRLYGQQGFANGLATPTDEELLFSLQQSQTGRWQSSNGNLYSAPPRLGYVPGHNKDGDISQEASVKRSLTSHSTSNSTLNSLYKLSRRHRTKERPVESSKNLGASKLKPSTVPTTRTTPVSSHFQEMTQLTT